MNKFFQTLLVLFFLISQNIFGQPLVAPLAVNQVPIIDGVCQIPAEDDNEENQENFSPAPAPSPAPQISNQVQLQVKSYGPKPPYFECNMTRGKPDPEGQTCKPEGMFCMFGKRWVETWGGLWCKKQTHRCTCTDGIYVCDYHAWVDAP